MEKYWIIKTSINGSHEEIGVATVCSSPSGAKNKYHVAFDGVMTIKFIDDIESLVVRHEFNNDTFAKDKLKNIKEGLYIYNKDYQK